MTALEAYDLTTKGGGGDFARVIAACESFGSDCLIGGLAVNCYVEPVYTLDADFVVFSEVLSQISTTASSDLRTQFTRDERSQPFPPRSQQREILGVQTKVARLEDVVQGKLWAYADSHRRLSKRKKDELDLIRLAEAYPQIRALYPEELLDQLQGL